MNGMDDSEMDGETESVGEVLDITCVCTLHCIVEMSSMPTPLMPGIIASCAAKTFHLL